MKCPFCGAQAYRRLGVHFDHEFMCSQKDCREVFDPGDIEDINQRKGVNGGMARDKSLSLDFKCGSCMYWTQMLADGHSQTGYCHRRPPVPMIMPVGLTFINSYQMRKKEEVVIEGVFPTTDCHEWCGAYEEDRNRAIKEQKINEAFGRPA